MTTLRLFHGSTQTEFKLYPRDDAGTVELQNLDLGFPEMREDTEGRTDTSGEIDNTRLYGARIISIELALLDLPLQVIDQLHAFLPPASRAWLLVGEDDWGGERRIRVRLADKDLTLTPGWRTGATVQLQFRAPEGVFETVDAQTQVFGATGVSSAGMVFPVTLPMTFPATTNGSSTTVTLPGGVPVHWTAKMYGPCTDPVLINDTTGARLAFTGLTIAAGDYLEVSTLNRTALINSLADASRLRQLVFLTSTWWQLQPGTNAIRFAPSTLGVGARAEMTWRTAWL